MYFIYKIENQINHNIYIGLTNNVARRRSRHFTDLRCNKHDNHFLQKEFNKYGEENFSFQVIFSGNVSVEEISAKEREYIKKYNSYLNGYNQNEGGNFGPSNGGSHLLRSDLLNILAALEFSSKPGQVLGDMFDVSRTTISRIKNGINHNEAREQYYALPLEERKQIYNIFCQSSNFLETKAQTTVYTKKRKLSEQDVHIILLNEELGRIIPIKQFCAIFNIASNTIYTILKQKSYKDYYISFCKLDENQKKELAQVLRNQYCTPLEMREHPIEGKSAAKPIKGKFNDQSK